MKKKLTILAFSLLLAVGWTSVAHAQLKAESPVKEYSKCFVSPAIKGLSGPISKQNLKKGSQVSLVNAGTSSRSFKDLTKTPETALNSTLKSAQNRAPKRAQYNITNDKTMTRAEYEAITYTWVDANDNTHPGTKLTEPASDPYQIAYLLGTTYMNKEIPGIKYSASHEEDHPYPNIEFGWDIPNNARWQVGTGTTSLYYNDITISIPSYWMDFDYIYVQSNGTTVEGGSWSYAVNGRYLPSNWGGTATLTAENNGCCTQQGGGTIVIPHSIIDGKENVTVVMSARKYNDAHSGTDCTVTIAGATPETNEYTTLEYTPKTWNINPTASGGSSASGTYYPGGVTIGVAGLVFFNSITVYDQNNNVLTSWDPNTAINNGQYSQYSDGYYFTIPDWNCSYVFDLYEYQYGQYYYYFGYLSYQHINIPANLLNGASSLRVVVNGFLYSDEEGYEGTLIVNGVEQPVTASAADYTWTITGKASQPTGTVTRPDDPGYTVFIVKAKDYEGQPIPFTYSWDNEGFTNLIDYFDTYIDEVELLTDGLRLNENTDDAGTMFSYSGQLNKFYFISKGANYWFGSSEADFWPHYSPTYDMYEEFSPTTTESGDQITDFYSKLLYGNSYNVIHDCRGVNVMQHYFSMSGNEGTEHKSMTNLIFWIPDNRGTTGQENNYDEEYLPHVGLYTIWLEAEAERAADYSTTNRMYDVTLDWVSSLNSILDFDVDQDYELWVYIYDDQGNPIADYKVLDRLQMQDLLIHNNTTFTYQVPQLATSQTIVYRVKGWPKDATNSPAKGGDFFALSNLDPVLIPGYENFLSLGVEHYESDFALDVEHNYYRNFLTVDNENPDNALTANRIENGEGEYELYRYDVAKPTQMTKAADLLFTVGNNKVTYDITYANQDYVDEANVYNEYNNANLQGYTNPDNLGCPIHGEIANISEGGGEIPVSVTQYVKVNSNDDLVTGEYLIVNESASKAFNGASTNPGGTGTNAINVTISNGIIESNSTTDAAVVTIDLTNGTVKTASGLYIYRSSGTSGGALTTSTTVPNYVNMFGVSSGDATIRCTGSSRYYYLRYNSSSSQFRYYTSSTSQQNIQLYKKVTSGGSGDYTLLNDFLDNSTYTQVGQVVFTLPWKSIQVKLQDTSAGTSSGYFMIQNGGKLRFVMPAGYNNANVKFVIHNAPASSNYYFGTFTLSSSTGDTQTITINEGSSTYADKDYEAIFMGISSGDVITITGTHTVDGTPYGYSPDFKYIHVYVQGGTGGISENDALNLDAIKFVDQFKAETSEDAHPYRYGYVLKDKNSNQESGRPEVPVLHTNSTVKGFYSLNDINNDVDREMVDPLNVMNAEVNMTLSRDPEIFYYTLDRKPSTVNNAQWEAISKLQKREDDSYNEILNDLPQYEDQVCNPPADLSTESWTVDRFDNYDVKEGGYNSFMSYVPVIWTHGDQKNRRVKWATENRHNSYGAPIWKTGVAKVQLTSVKAERQEDISTKWTYAGEECSLYMLDDITAVATMPTLNNVKYVPYMFRIFVKSDNHKLRGYTRVAAGEDPNKPGEHYEGAPIANDELKCVWSGYVNDLHNADYNVTISEDVVNNAKVYTFHKDKVDRTNPGGEWDKDIENAIFAAPENLIQGEGENMYIAPNDLTIIVRFYYLVEGFDDSAPNVLPNRGNRGEGSDPAGYGTEGEGFTPGPATAVRELILNGVIESVTYVNAQGMQSSEPFDGLNIVITRYSNGAVRTTKVIK